VTTAGDATTSSGTAFTELAAEFGTPLYVYDGDRLARQYIGLRELLHERMEMFFSLKSNPNLSVCAFLRGLGARAEVSSRAELLTALRAGVSPQDIVFLGPGKSLAELEACLEAGIAALVCESFGELALIDRLAAERGLRPRVALRVNPEFAVKGAGLTMGGKPRQFGIDEAALLAGEKNLADRHPNVDLIGVHAYMGTRILNEDVIVENTTRILDLAERISERLGFPLELVDIGGGLGVAYFENESDLDHGVLAKNLNPVIADFAERHPGTRMVMELGRYLVADAGTYVASVRYVKESMGQRFAVLDGGTNHHMAAVGVGSIVRRNFPIAFLGRPNASAYDPTVPDAATPNTGSPDTGSPDTEPPNAESVPWQLAGPLCTPNDTLGKDVVLPASLRPGDLIGVRRSGAYGPTASPTGFLSHGFPAEVLVAEGGAHLVRRRESVEDLLRSQILYTEGNS
jgi:diaminopimelate decarboxylase